MDGTVYVKRATIDGWRNIAFHSLTDLENAEDCDSTLVQLPEALSKRNG